MLQENILTRKAPKKQTAKLCLPILEKDKDADQPVRSYMQFFFTKAAHLRVFVSFSVYKEEKVSI